MLRNLNSRAAKIQTKTLALHLCIFINFYKGQTGDKLKKTKVKIYLTASCAIHSHTFSAVTYVFVTRLLGFFAANNFMLNAAANILGVASHTFWLLTSATVQTTQQTTKWYEPVNRNNGFPRGSNDGGSVRLRGS